MDSSVFRTILFYDGQCRFCETQSARLLRLARPGAIERRDFQQPGALDGMPVSHDQCMKAMQLVMPDGRVYAGFEAAVRAVATRTVGKLAYVYYVPGLRQLLDGIYALIARNRYRLAKKAVAFGECDGGTCHLHFPEDARESRQGSGHSS